MKSFVKGPVFSGLLGAMLLLSGFFEIADLTFEHWLGPAIGVEHGVFAWGLGQVLKSLVDIVDGVEGLAGG